ncbi:MAG TPA: acyltransferase [Puia sp.]|nr:acyltransferase [Puia sp.]
MSFTLENAIERKNNNFDFIRLVASLAVIFGHSFYIFLTNGYSEPFKQILVDNYSGSIAVYIFFFLSGIFISSSFVNSKNLAHFVLMRVFRIWPALITCILITVFIIGPIFTTYTLHKYFFDTQTWKYLFKNCLMLRFEPRIQSVFANNHLNEALNGSLWTLPMEITCYMIVFIFGLAGVFKHRMTVILGVVVLILVCHYLPRLKGYLFINVQTKFFFAGILSFTFKDYIILNRKLAIGIIFAACVFYFLYFRLFEGVFYIALIYGMLILATSKIVRKIKLPGDYSYGIYIYGYLIQQIIAHLFPNIKAYPSMLLTVPLSVIAGMISWHYIESPAIKIGKELSQSYNNNAATPTYGTE